MVSKLLVSAITLIHGIEQHVDGERRIRRPAGAMTPLKRLVPGSVVDDEDFHLVGIREAGGYPAHHRIDRPFGVISDDEDQYPRFLTISHDPCLWQPVEAQHRAISSAEYCRALRAKPADRGSSRSALDPGPGPSGGPTPPWRRRYRRRCTPIPPRAACARAHNAQSQAGARV